MSYKSIEVTGKTEDEAIANALRELSMDRDQVSIEIIARAKSGFLGFKTTPAVVKVTFEVPDEPEAPEEAAPVPPETMDPAERSGFSASDLQAQNTNQGDMPAELAEAAERARIFIQGLLEKMDISAEPVMSANERGIIAEIRGSDLGGVIGRKGETLDAIQHITNYSVNKDLTSKVRIYLDAENYRQKREQALESLAKRMADKAVKFKRSFTLEPMNAYERHVVHTALQSNKQVKTFSTGSEPNRRVVVSYVGNQDGQ